MGNLAKYLVGMKKAVQLKSLALLDDLQ